MNGKWTLILDNVDDDTVLLQKMQAGGSSGGPTQSLLAYLPQSPNGSILVTTRPKSVALRPAEESDIIPVEPMNDTDALALLKKKLGKYIDRDNTPKPMPPVHSIITINGCLYFASHYSSKSIQIKRRGYSVAS